MRAHGYRTVKRSGKVLALVAAAAALALAGCSSGKPDSSWHGGGSASPTQNDSKAVAKILEPASGATDVPAAAEIKFSAEHAVSSTFELKDADGDVVEGKLRDDKSSWVPATALEYGTQYTATLTATDADGKEATATSTFTTMAKPAKTVRVMSFLGDNAVVGVAMPLIVRFSRPIPESKRADVQRRLFVTSDPPQEGIWHWVSPTEVRYRTKTYWRPGTKISYRLATGGLPMGDGYYGRSDVTVVASVGRALSLTVDNKTKMMTVVRDGKVLRKIPVSLGKAKTPSSSGTMVIIEKLRKTVFDTYDELGPVEGYRTDIEYAQRLTWGGEYIHAAPWSEGVQGRTNVSHGCVNISMANAKWLFGITMMGDPVVVKGTERKLENGNGWTDWNVPWSEYVKGSAIPYQPAA
ncbi:MAG: L,D-transpeptidase family protein [Micromonosporaceae bacterium]|jgi:lipoprotein-anchoring transpeptidase ErfK/SrfK|nr:L,D-transpeptidase family protein [Micromonosporaceae bacterium]